MQCEWLKVDTTAQRSERHVFRKWLDSTAEILGALQKIGEFSPFHDNEIAAVSILLGGASRAHFPAASEYSVRKRRKDDGRRWKWGRADLWFTSGTEYYSFEFKMFLPGRRWPRTLIGALEEARGDIARVDATEYSRAFGVAICPEFDEPNAHIPECLARDDVNYVCRITHRRQTWAHIFFSRAAG